MARKKSTLPQLNSWEYNPTTLQRLELRDLKALYSAERGVMQKRVNRLKQSEFTEVDVLKEYSEGIPTLKQLASIAEGDTEFLKSIIARELADLHMYMESRYSLVSELREIRDKSIETLHEHGYTFVTKENYQDFVEFQNYLKQSHLDRIYDSDGTPQESSTEDPYITEEANQNLEKMFKDYLKNGGSLPVEYHIRNKV